MHLPKKPLALICSACLSSTMILGTLAGCASSPATSSAASASSSSSSTAQDITPDPDRAAIERIVHDDILDAFAANSTTASIGNGSGMEGHNSCFSPISLYLALAMVGAGTDGEAQQQLLELLGLEDSTNLEQFCSNLLRNLQTQDDEWSLVFADSIWAGSGYTFQPDYLKTVQQFFNAEAFSVNFGTAEADDQMSKWVSENTNGLLNPKFQTDAAMVASLINTLYFKDAWLHSFPESETAPGTFHTAQGEVTADLMHNTTDKVNYAELGNCTAAQMPFANGATMTFYLPTEGITPSELVGDPYNIMQLLDADFELAEVQWTMPKFTLDSSFYDLADAMQLLGVTNIFEPDTDAFTPMLSADNGSDNSFFVSDIIQETHLALDENGVEAAAYTAIMMETTALIEDMKQVEFVLDRPFAYTLTAQDGTVLFIGTVENPTA